MRIAIFIFDGITALDAIGPYEILGRLPGAQVTFCALEAGVCRTDTGALGLVADKGIDDVEAADLLNIPGGPRAGGVASDPRLQAWVRRVHATTRWTCSVCTGALILAAAGLLDGQPATTHWYRFDALAALGAVPVRERVVVSGRIITAAGVSAGIDMALQLAAILGGEALAQALQLSIEYDPAPPFDAGSPDKAPPEILASVKAFYAERDKGRS